MYYVERESHQLTSAISCFMLMGIVFDAFSNNTQIKFYLCNSGFEFYFLELGWQTDLQIYNVHKTCRSQCYNISIVKVL